MTLPASGQIQMSQVNTELGRSSTAQIQLAESAVRTLAGVPSGTISLNNLHGKSSFTAVNPLGFNGGTYSDADDFSNYVQLEVYSNGTWAILGQAYGTFATGNWGTPTTTGVGSGYYFRRTATLVSSSGGGSFSASSGWLSLASTQYAYVTSTASGPGTHRRYYSFYIKISPDQSNVVAAGTCELRTQALYTP